jgi:hypothetical protein
MMETIKGKPNGITVPLIDQGDTPSWLHLTRYLSLMHDHGCGQIFKKN